jgi:hypothetical protein
LKIVSQLTLKEPHPLPYAVNGSATSSVNGHRSPGKLLPARVPGRGESAFDADFPDQAEQFFFYPSPRATGL